MPTITAEAAGTARGGEHPEQEQSQAVEESSLELTLTGVSVVVAFAGLGLAWLFYIKRRDLPDKIADSLGGLYTVVLNKYYVDEIYGATIIRPLIALSTRVLWRGIDATLIDGSVNSGARGVRECWRFAASPAVRQHPLLRRLGYGRSGAGHPLHGLDGNAMIAASVNPYILTLVTFVPVFGALLLALFPRRDRDIRAFALLVSIVTFLLSLHLPWYFRYQFRHAQPHARQLPSRL